MLYNDGYTIRGVQKVIKENGTRKIIKRESISNLFTEAEKDNIDHSNQTSQTSRSISETKRMKLMNVLNDLVSLKKKLNQD